MGAHDVLTALLIERAGFETVFLGGFGASASLRGLPDLNFLTLEDMSPADLNTPDRRWRHWLRRAGGCQAVR